MFLTVEKLQEALDVTGLKLCTYAYYNYKEKGACALGNYFLSLNPHLLALAKEGKLSVIDKLISLAFDTLGKENAMAFTEGFDGAGNSYDTQDERYEYWSNGKLLREKFL